MGLSAAIQRGGDGLRAWWLRRRWRRIGHRSEVVAGSGSEAGRAEGRRVKGRRGGAGTIEAGRGDLVGESGDTTDRGGARTVEAGRAIFSVGAGEIPTGSEVAGSRG